MVEPISAAGAGLAVFVGKDILNKLLGPTAEYLGGELKSYTEKGVNNVKKIFEKAVNKLGQKINEPGQVPPRVLKGILSEGYFCEDELSSEYFGGVMASSRTGVSRDDRAVTYINLLSSLSTYQIRTHYILYTVIKRLFAGSEMNIREAANLRRMETYMPFKVYAKAMDFKEYEKDLFNFLDHSVLGLRRNNLLTVTVSGDKEYLDKQGKGLVFSESGFLFYPTFEGIELYHWAHGKGDTLSHDFLKIDFASQLSDVVVIPTGSFAIELEKERQNKEKESKKSRGQ